MIEGTPSPARAPAVVAVVVTTDPGPWFEESLRALAAQDYESLSVLVIVSGGTDDPTELVASVLPDAFVGRLEGAGGFGAAVNHAMTMIEGAPFLLLCHDDCAPAPDVVHLMVEESFRSNAAVVSPKVVSWDDTRALLHVGQGVDKTGAVVERVQEGEMDAGQHDAVRDVFVAPGGCTLVRTDLLRAVGGYDTAAGGVGNDLDLSWRAHVAGARIVVAPAAVVRHLELVSSGRREPPETDAPSLDALHRRREVAAMFVCYTWPHLFRVLPQAVALGIGEFAVAAAWRDRARASAIAHAWWWSLSQPSEIRRRRAALARMRTLPDADVRRLQVRGSARLSRFVSRTIHRTPLAGSAEELATAEERTPAPTRFGATARARLVIWIVTAAVLVFGSRGLIGTHWSLVGQLAPFPEWTSLWHHFFTPWQAAGIGSSAPPSPAFAALGVLGTFLVGRMGLLQQVVVLGCVPLGAWGVSRLLRPFGSVRARVGATLAYLALPLGLDALSRGRWDGLVAYAAMPWVVGMLARSSGLAPFDHSPFDHGERGAHRAWRRTLLGRSVVLGVVEAVAVCVAPSVAVCVLTVGVGIALGSLLAGGWRQGARSAVAAGLSTMVAAVLCAPWLVGTLRAGWGALAVLGLPGASVSEPGWSGLLRLGVGPIGTSPLSWLLLGVAVVPLVLARGTRFAWATRLWSITVVSWLVALVAAKAWAAPFAPSVDVVLAPAAVGIAGAVGIAVASFERDLAGHRFGWRQGVAVLSVAATLVGFLPTVAAAGEGAWSLPASGYAGAVSHASAASPGRGDRVLWLGAPQALPVGGWAIAPGLAYGLSNGPTPDLTDVWAPATPGRASVVADDVRAAMLGRTVRLGGALARLGVRSVAVVGGLWTSTPGTQAFAPYPPPAGLLPALERQVDLETVPVSVGGMTELHVTGVAGVERSPAQPSSVARLLDPLAAGLAILGWIVAVAVLIGRRRWRSLRPAEVAP